MGIEKKPSLLLHSCCGPCSSAVLERLVPDYEVTVLYYNPNIEPREEYDKRLSEQKRLLAEMDLPYPVQLIEGSWDPEEFLTLAAGHEHDREGGARCAVCFTQRLTETARRAAEGGFDFFTTTLSVSPYKNAELLNELGEKAGAEFGVAWLSSNFKKKDGYRRSVELSRQYGLYRQNYCGCRFSLANREAADRKDREQEEKKQ